MADTIPTVRRLIRNLLLAGWTGLWLLVFVVGWLVHSAPTLGISVAALSLVWLIVAVKARRASKALELRARTSLVARAERNRLRLARPMLSALSAFDLHSRRIAALTEDPGVSEIELGLKIQADLEHARDHVYALATLHAQQSREAADLRRRGAGAAASAARAGLERELKEIEGRANQVVLDSQRLAERLTAVRSLASGDVVEASRTLGDVVEDLDRTVAAYREIDEEVESRRQKLGAREREASGKGS